MASYVHRLASYVQCLRQLLFCDKWRWGGGGEGGEGGQT
jgi:hypothetical protein